MKIVVLYFLLLTLSSFALNAMEPIHVTIPLVLAILTGIWEVIGRLIPSLGQITAIGKIIEILNWLSNFLNRKK
jgi:hypothetical protein